MHIFSIWYLLKNIFQCNYPHANYLWIITFVNSLVRYSLYLEGMAKVLFKKRRDSQKISMSVAPMSR